MKLILSQKKAGITEYYQVSETVLDPNTLNRELAPLEAINDQYPKFLLTLDELNKMQIMMEFNNEMF